MNWTPAVLGGGVDIAIASGLDGGSSSPSASVGPDPGESGVVPNAPFTGACAFMTGEAGACDSGCDRIASGEIKYMHLHGDTLVTRAERAENKRTSERAGRLYSCDPLYFPGDVQSE
jgi:hypothetical protein